MTAVRVEADDGRPVCESCLVADTPLRRLRGLLGRERFEPGEGLLLRPAGSVHTSFMRFPIDVVFLDREATVVGVAEEVAPWRVVARRGARSVLELPAGEARRRRVDAGQRLRIGATP